MAVEYVVPSLDKSAVIARYEYKYLISESVAQQLQTAIQPYCRLDTFSDNYATGHYRIDSIYWDSPSYALYWANERELFARYKLRIRSYPDDPYSQVFLEVKKRRGDAVKKLRAAIARDQVMPLLIERNDALIRSLPAGQRRNVETFLAYTGISQAYPVTLVRYHRHAYTSRFEDDVRITFDRSVQSQLKSDCSFEVDPFAWRVQDHAIACHHDAQNQTSSVILELKFSPSIPIWLINLVTLFGLVRQSYSKYARAIDAWHMPLQPRHTVLYP